MKASDVKCPKCGEGFVDIDPDYNIGRNGEMDSLLRGVRVNGHCRNGHRLDVEARFSPNGESEFLTQALEPK